MSKLDKLVNAAEMNDEALENVSGGFIPPGLSEMDVEKLYSDYESTKYEYKRYIRLGLQNTSAYTDVVIALDAYEEEFRKRGLPYSRED